METDLKKMLGGLTRSCREVYRWIKRLARPECWASTARIAELAGYAVRSVQVALKVLQNLGLIQVVNDCSLRSRHRIVLLAESPSGTTSIVSRHRLEGPGERTDCAHLGAVSAPTSGPVQLYSVVRERENQKDDDGSLVSRRVSASEESTTRSSSSSSVSPPVTDTPTTGNQDSQAGHWTEWLPGARRPATSTEVNDLVAHAAEVYRSEPWIGRRVLSLADRWGVAWVEAALDQCERALKRDKRVGWIYLVRCCERFALEGGMPRPAALLRQCFEPEVQEAEMRLHCLGREEVA